MRYSLQDLDTTDSQSPSLVIAFANLMAQVGEEISPSDLQIALTKKDTSLNWLSLPEHFDWLYIESASDIGGWPTTNDAIVKFGVLDQGSTVEHYCLVADPLDRTIVDSYDGRIKPAAVYGNPLTWASYNERDTNNIEQELIEKANKAREENSYTIASGETIWSIAVKLGIDGKELLDHNDITADQATVGTTLHLLKPRTIINDTTEIRYEPYPKAIMMHVSHPGGTRKFIFGNVRKWDDLKHSGPFFAENTNVEIVAQALVPIGDDSAMYYMDAYALGKYLETGRVAYTLGFSYKHLSEGAYIAPEPPIVEPPVPLVVIAPIPEPEPEYQKRLDDLYDSQTELAKQGTSYKSTYRAFEGGRRRYQAIKDLTIYDIDCKRPKRPMHRFQHVTLVGSFIYGEREYGRTAGSVETGNWYGVPLEINCVVWVDEPEKDEYMFDYSEATNMPLAERIATGYGHLSKTDRAYIIWQRLLSDAAIAKNKVIKRKKK